MHSPARRALLGIAAVLACDPGRAIAAEPTVTLKRYTTLVDLDQARSVKPARALDLAPALVLNYFATWCEPCKAEMPEVVELSQKKGVEVYVVGLLTDKDEATGRCGGLDALRAYFDGHPLRDRVLVDECGGFLELLTGKPEADLPLTFLFDGTLRAAKVQRGRAPKGKRLADALEPELGRILRAKRARPGKGR